MNDGQKRSISWIVLIAAVGVFIILLDPVLKLGSSHTLLFTLVYWIALVEGCIALVAAVEAAEGKWIITLKPVLLSVYPVLFLITILFVFIYPKFN